MNRNKFYSDDIPLFFKKGEDKSNLSRNILLECKVVQNLRTKC